MRDVCGERGLDGRGKRVELWCRMRKEKESLGRTASSPKSSSCATSLLSGNESADVLHLCHPTRHGPPPLTPSPHHDAWYVVHTLCSVPKHLLPSCLQTATQV